MKRKKKSAVSGFGFFSFLDILFSTMGILVLVTAVNFLLVRLEVSLPDRPIYTKDEINEILNKQELLGSFYWLNPIYLTVSSKQYVMYHNGIKKVFTDQDKMEKKLFEIGEENCIKQENNIAGRSVIVFGIYQSGYLYYNSLSLAIEEINTELKSKYGSNYFPLQEGKELLSSNELSPRWQQIINNSKIESK